MRVLVLDDDTTRLQWFRQKYRGHEVVCVTNVDDALNALDGERFDLVCLDHDLGDFAYVPYPVERTGVEVAAYVAKLPEDKRPHVVSVHSWNPHGAKQMADILRDAGLTVNVQPFSHRD